MPSRGSARAAGRSPAAAISRARSSSRAGFLVGGGGDRVGHGLSFGRIPSEPTRPGARDREWSGRTVGDSGGPGAVRQPRVRGERGAGGRERLSDVDPVITLEHVSKRFGDVVAVHEAHFEIGRGEFFSMLGPSGCGKTTTLRMIAGFEQPSGGRILLEGHDVSHTPPYRRNVNTVFQHYALFPHMSVRDNVAFGPRSRGLPEGGDRPAGGRAPGGGPPRGLRRPPAGAALRRPAAAGRAGARARQLPERAAARRAARRARPQTAPGDADRAQADPARGRDHVHLRDARPGRGADHVGPHRGDERGARRPARRAAGDLPPAGHAVRRHLHRRRQPAAGAHRRGRGRRRRPPRWRAAGCR